MPRLSDVRHEMFCRYMAQGMAQADAYEKAGYSRSSGNASIMNQKPFIKERIDELVVERMAMQGYETVGALERFDAAADEVERTGTISREWVLKELIENSKMAREAGQFAASNAALGMLGKEIGMFIEKPPAASDASKANSDQQKAIPVEQVNKLLGALGFQGAVDLKTMEPVKVSGKRLSKDKKDADQG